jgi:hypothetical protein
MTIIIIIITTTEQYVKFEVCKKVLPDAFGV